MFSNLLSRMGGKFYRKRLPPLVEEQLRQGGRRGSVRVIRIADDDGLKLYTEGRVREQITSFRLWFIGVGFSVLALLYKVMRDTVRDTVGDAMNTQSTRFDARLDKMDSRIDTRFNKIEGLLFRSLGGLRPVMEEAENSGPSPNPPTTTTQQQLEVNPPAKKGLFGSLKKK